MKIFYKNFLNYHPNPRRDSISRSIAPVSSVANGDYTTRPRRQGITEKISKFICLTRVAERLSNWPLESESESCQSALLVFHMYGTNAPFLAPSDYLE
jgi:hypothetical protein